jgi:uncharacterized protein (TIGR04222 family)
MNEPTWGISGPTFLWIYAAAFVVSACGAWLRRKSLLNAQDGRAPSGTPDVYEIAMLNGGPKLAITIATAKLHRLGALVTASGKKLRAAGRPKSDLAELEHEVFDAVERVPGITARKLEQDLVGGTAIQRLSADLTRSGLLLDDAARAKVNTLWLWFVPVLALGAARVAAGIQHDRPVTFIVLAVAAIAFITLKVAMSRPRATARGQEMLDRERAGRKTLGHVPIGSEIPMAVALFGAGALWAADPGLASTMSIARERSAWTGGGGCGAGGGGGCGGGGCGGGGCGG